ncbi:MAG: N-acetylmuramoyl-L-alanine amidase [Rhodospirillaceae bacterium]|nr:MAG: N-acetylmuramoyl-L-alanine amidase [Rhodospirillaceae bacterium]
MGVTIFEHPSPNCEPRPQGVAIDTLVLHYTGMKTAKAALARLCDPKAGVSAHYLIDEAGQITALVPEEARAWHAGKACWQGAENLNDRSIGVEIANPGHEFGYRPFPEAQMAALEGLLLGILARHTIAPARVLGHSDIAPDRKEDPGELFDWQRLARAGIGRWPDNQRLNNQRPENTQPPPPIGKVQTMLHQIGYAVPLTGQADAATEKVIAAFQRHFRPARIDGVADGETVARLRALLEGEA